MINGLLALARNAPHAGMIRDAGLAVEKRPATYLPTAMQVLYAAFFGFMFVTFLGL